MLISFVFQIGWNIGLNFETGASHVHLKHSTSERFKPSGHGGPRNYGSAFLPAAHQATTIGSSGKLGSGKIENLSTGESLTAQRKQLDLLQSLNRNHLNRSVQDEQIEGAIESFELAFRMQQTAPDVLDLSREPKSIQDLYGVDKKETSNFEIWRMRL